MKFVLQLVIALILADLFQVFLQWARCKISGYLWIKKHKNNLQSNTSEIYPVPDEIKEKIRNLAVKYGVSEENSSKFVEEMFLGNI